MFLIIFTHLQTFYLPQPFLALCMVGKTLGAAANLLNAVYLDSWGRWVWLATVMPVQNISGGVLTFVMMTYSFIADNSSPRERMIRLAVMGFMWDVSTPIALPLSAWLFNTGGYVCVMATSLGLYVLACLLGLLRLWNFKENKKSSTATLWGVTDYWILLLRSLCIFLQN